MSSKPAFILLLFLLATGMLVAQDRSFSTLPMVRKPGMALRGAVGRIDSAAYQRALGVYNRLVQARGDFRYPVPTFVMSAVEYQVASIDYKKLEITLEQKAYEVCASFGPENTDAAIAFLLGHELTHYYEKHLWREGFVDTHNDLAIGIQLDSLLDDVADETEADYLGGFLAYSAGYGVFEQNDEMIGRLYKTYQMPDDIVGYPTLSDRQALNRRSTEQLKQLVEVFDMANLLTAVGRYADAFEYYRYVLMQYQSREIYNNVGVVAVLDALQYFNESEMKFRLPLELDLESSGSKGDGMANIREKLLRQAILHFDAAISLDPDYAPAYLNKACAYLLLKDYARARFYAELEAKAAATRGQFPKTTTDADILLGIIDAYEGKTDAARATFERAKAAGSALAEYNLDRLDGKPIVPETPPPPSLRQERINNQALALIAADPSIDPKKDKIIGPHAKFLQNPAQGLRIAQNLASGELLFFQCTPDGYTGQTARGIGIGAERTAISAKYGDPHHTVETPQGQIMVYAAMLFILDKNGKLVKWANYLLS